MLLPLQTRPDLTLIAVVGLIAVILFLVKMAEDIQTGVQSPTSENRRSFIETIIALFVMLFLLAFTLPSAITSLERESCWLTVEDGQTYQISSGETEEYCGAAIDGTLNLNGTMELSG